MSKAPKSQSDRILTFLKSGRKLTPLQAFNKFQCLSLSQRIGGLLRAGHPIKRERKKVGNKSVGLYSYGR